MSNADDEYASYLDAKSQLDSDDGFEATFYPEAAFDHQRALIEWSVRKGRSAIFANCGLGKTLDQLAFAENAVRHSNKSVLILTPLAVSHQTIEEATKFGMCAVRSRDGSLPSSASIVVTNYEQLAKFNPNDFSGVVCDESSILKSFDGSTRRAITEFMRKTRYRLLCTATAAPNDFIELGTSSEALGYLGHMDMLAKFFKNDQNTCKPMRGFRGNRAVEGTKWRFRGHAEQPFWRWVCSWARAIRMPSDIGCSDEGYVLPELIHREHIIGNVKPPPGMLINLPAIGLKEQRVERRRTISERCENAASLVADTGHPAIMWGHLNDECDMMAELVKDSVQISGADSDESKEEKFIAFVNGQARVLVTKPSIGAWGLNFQHCAHMTFFPSHSFEQFYQGTRRCWRFGQTKNVIVDSISSEGEAGVIANLERKTLQAESMFANLVTEMGNASGVARRREFDKKAKVPTWL